MLLGKYTLGALAAVAALSTITVAPALANHDGTYFAIERTAVSIDSSSGVQSEEISPTGIRLKVGTGISHAFDLEAQFGGATDEPAGPFDEFDAAYAGVYLKGYLPLGFRSALFGMGGFSWMELTEIIDDRELSDRRAGFSYGFGLETQISDNIDLSADYMRYTQDEGIYDEISTINFGVKVYF